MIFLTKYDKAVIVSSDGDYYRLVRYLKETGKLLYVIGTNNRVSWLLRREAGSSLLLIDQIRSKIEKVT
ncbi:MAG: hypothetical protein AUJ99_01000 [Caldisericum sp. CG2_30_36_11]|nr:MAG: hypothetical protein AUJ99_01000 [Caldisericum sp. CG2_30_36_11]